MEIYVDAINGGLLLQSFIFKVYSILSLYFSDKENSNSIIETIAYYRDY